MMLRFFVFFFIRKRQDSSTCSSVCFCVCSHVTIFVLSDDVGLGGFDGFQGNFAGDLDSEGLQPLQIQLCCVCPGL